MALGASGKAGSSANPAITSASCASVIVYRVSPRSAAAATSGKSAYPPLADSAMPSRIVRVYQGSSRSGLGSRSASGASDISVPITSNATTSGRGIG